MAERVQLDELQCAAAIKRAQRYLLVMRKLQQTFFFFFFFLLDQVIKSLHYKESAQQGQAVRTAQPHGGLWVGWYVAVYKVFFTGPVSFI